MSGDGITTPRTYPEDSDEWDRYTGQYQRGEFWYRCEVCRRIVPGSYTTRQTLTAGQHGKRVCLRCVDQPGTDDLRPQMHLPDPPDRKPP